MSAQAALADCNLAEFNLPDTPPAVLAEILSYDCVDDTRLSPDEAIAKGLDMGYPSLLAEQLPSDDLLALLNELVAAGDRGYFAHDPDIVTILADMDRDTTAMEVFVLAARDPEAALALSPSPDAVMAVLPIWQMPENTRRIAQWCDQTDCGPTEQQCSAPISLAVKAQIARGDRAVTDLITQCDPTPQWLSALRHAGMVDTQCTLQHQFNGVQAGTLDLAAPCYSDWASLIQGGGTNSSEISRVIRFMHRGQNVPWPTPDIAAAISFTYPDLGPYYAAQDTGPADQ